MMINAALIRNYLEDELTRRGHFLVEVLVRPGNKIIVYMDSMKGVTLEECITISRFLEHKLDRNVEDFELEVSSPGVDKPLKLPVQYEKNIGRMLDVVKYDGIKITGQLCGIHQGLIQLATEAIIKDSITGKKKKEQKMLEIRLEDVKAATINISLKK